MSFGYMGMNDYSLESAASEYSYLHPPHHHHHPLPQQHPGPAGQGPNVPPTVPGSIHSGSGHAGPPHPLPLSHPGPPTSMTAGFQYPVMRQDVEAAPPQEQQKPKKKSKKERKRKSPGTALSREEIKRRRNAGEEYVTRKGKIIKKKEFVPIDCKCRLNCTIKVPHDVRKLIFDQYHALADWNNQTQFIVSSVTVLDVKERKKRKIKQEISDSSNNASRRTASRIFYLTNKKVRVCKPVFLTTLGITNKRLDYALRHKALPVTSLATPDFRGKKGAMNKTPAEVEDKIRHHINSFPKPGKSNSKSSTCKSNQPTTSGSTSSTDLTISKMYSLYQEQCRLEGITPASMWVYSKIYHSESKGHPVVIKKESLCKSCERTRIILKSGYSAEKIVQMLLREYQENTSSSSSGGGSSSSVGGSGDGGSNNSKSAGGASAGGGGGGNNNNNTHSSSNCVGNSGSNNNAAHHEVNNFQPYGFNHGEYTQLLDKKDL